MVEMVVARLGIDSATNSFVVILREKHGRRVLPIWIGKPEAESILMEMNSVKRERPLTHDLCKALVLALNGELRRVTISRVVKRTYYAELHLATNSNIVQVDARPSDSIAIALRLSAPIFAADALLAEPDDDIDDEPDAPPVGELSAEQLKAYLADLQPEDFGKFNP